MSLADSPSPPTVPTGPLPSVEELTARSRGENFPVALRVLPARHREMLMAVYAWARLVDEVGDAAEGDRLALLDDLEGQLSAAVVGADDVHPAVAAVAGAVRSGRLPRQPLVALVDANRQDQRVRRYATWEELMGYCELSANPVGRLVLAVFEASDGTRDELSDDVCSALQVLEHLQDVSEDAADGRIYLPATDMDRFGVGEADLTASASGAPLRGLVAYETWRCRRLLASGAPLVRSLRGAARVAVAGFVAGGLATADALAAARYDVVGRRPKPSKAGTAAHAARLLAARSDR
ncbi:MAG TPA: squalene synthase HpnC [Acidimicrobiales bacterium]|nr:squalene synthase HpnC [Acidimicrobiales bacterium]